jgi:uncharacterized protein (DUF697 family)
MTDVQNDVVEQAVVVDTATVSIDPERSQRLEKIARNHVLTASGIGLVPIPIADVVALLAVQMDLIRDLAKEYEIPFRKDIGKSVVMSLLGSLGPVGVGITMGSLIKCIPLIGSTTGAVTLPAIAGATTYAIYKVFVQHFESGGTFLDMDPAKVKSYFAEEFSKSKKVVKDMKAEEGVPSAS